MEISGLRRTGSSPAGGNIGSTQVAHMQPINHQPLPFISELSRSLSLHCMLEKVANVAGRT